ncbi:AMP-binding protein [Mycobacterium sp.]|uniref:AMP-binding protein n=1 Tax=Mycobacterium sp. TaxID=1785 RepID=UPI002DA38958|nr:AMP-binding protein [Mycobacterium sp.]
MTTLSDLAAGVVPYPESLVREYRADGLWGTRTIADELQLTIDTYGSNPAVADSDVQFTFEELGAITDRIAAGLVGLGLTPGERVMFQVTNHAWSVLAWYGVLKAGLVPVATLAQHGSHEINAIAKQCRPAAHLFEPPFGRHDLRALAHQVAEAQPSLRVKLTVGTGQSADGEVSIEALADQQYANGNPRQLVAEIQHSLATDGVAVLQLSGGTTSVPKLIPRLHAEYWYNARAWAEVGTMTSDSAVAHLLPLIHNAGIVCALHAAHAVGACFVTSAVNTEAFLRAAARTPLTHILMTRPILRLIETEPRLRNLLAGLRTLAWGDRAVPPSVIDEFETDTCKVIQLFGMGEGLTMLSPRDAPAAIRHGTQGTPVCLRDEVRVYEPGTETQLPEGHAGELCVRGPYTIRGYYDAPERNAVAFTADGLYRSGDIVTEFRHEGRSYYRLEDRIKDLINRGGEKINAEEVEQLLLELPGVERAAVVAMPDDRLGEKACAFFALRPGADTIDLDAVRVYLQTRGVAKFKWPERIEIRSELPLTNIHKVNKVMLRQEIADLLRAGDRAAT